jgi:predicted nucleic acid-binding protein
LTYLLDTDVVSQTSKPHPDIAVMRWWKQQDELSLMLSVIVFQELRFGIEMLAPGKKRSRLEEWLEIRLRGEFAGRILPVTAEIAELSGRLMVETKKAGRRAEGADALITATARVHGLRIATLNRSHFSGWVWSWWSFEFALSLSGRYLIRHSQKAT